MSLTLYQSLCVWRDWTNTCKICSCRHEDCGCWRCVIYTCIRTNTHAPTHSVHSTHPTDISQLCIYAYDRIAMFTIGGIYAAFDGSYTDTHELCIQLLDAANATVNDCQLHAHAHTAREYKRRLYRSTKRTIWHGNTGISMYITASIRDNHNELCRSQLGACWDKHNATIQRLECANEHMIWIKFADTLDQTVLTIVLIWHLQQLESCLVVQHTQQPSLHFISFHSTIRCDVMPIVSFSTAVILFLAYRVITTCILLWTIVDIYLTCSNGSTCIYVIHFHHTNCFQFVTMPLISTRIYLEID